jgi:hypothetical protein
MTRQRLQTGSAPSPYGGALPGAPTGLTLARMMAAARTERSGRRVGQDAAMERREAEAALASLEPDRRESAAGTLGYLLFKKSYGPLMSALRTENSRSVQFALLKALADIGAEHSSQPFSEGAAPIKQFILSRLEDPKLVEAAMEAFIWTGSTGKVLASIREMSRAAQESGLTAAGTVLSHFPDRLLFR